MDNGFLLMALMLGQMWSFYAKVEDASVENIQFAIAYKVNEITYWDNNYGRNYSITVPETILLFFKKSCL